MQKSNRSFSRLITFTTSQLRPAGLAIAASARVRNSAGASRISRPASPAARRGRAPSTTRAPSECANMSTGRSGASSRTRSASSAHVYTSWLFVADSVAITLFGLAWKGPRALAPTLSFIGPGLAGGAMSLASYWIAIWAMTQAPIGLVAAVRESSVLFGAVIAVVVLHEPLRRERLIAAALIVAGLALIKLH